MSRLIDYDISFYLDAKNKAWQEIARPYFAGYVTSLLRLQPEDLFHLLQCQIELFVLRLKT